MKFHLNYTPGKASFQIDHHSSLLLSGSCFTENVGAFLKDFKFNASVNPGGILFNPISILNDLNTSVLDQAINEKFILERDGLFYSYLHNTSFCSADKAALLEKINSTTHCSHEFLKNATVLILTFGTAYTYFHKQLNHTVANCHKQAQGEFKKSLLSVKDIVDSYSDLIKTLKAFNPGLKLIFTVSPVKYLKDGVEENNLSKSTLRLAIHALMEQFENCFYFPAFELVNDDLRDYRFYKEDLAHPNPIAIDYVWQKFSECYFSSKTIELNQQIHKLNQVLNHRTMQENSQEKNKLNAFIERQKEEILKLDSRIKL